MTPAGVALMGATLALLLAHNSKIDTVHNILRDVDWSTLIFFMSFFVLIGGLEKAGIIQQLSQVMAQVLGNNMALNALFILLLTGVLSSLVPNIPLAVAMIKFLSGAGGVGECGDFRTRGAEGTAGGGTAPLFRHDDRGHLGGQWHVDRCFRQYRGRWGGRTTWSPHFLFDPFFISTSLILIISQIHQKVN